MGTPIIIELLAAETAWTNERSLKWYEDRIASGSVPKNHQPEERRLPDTQFGARCEAASYKWAKPVDWKILRPWRPRQPDLHDFIDVKGVEKAHHALIVRPDDEDNWAFLLVDGSAEPFYHIIGWCWGSEAKTQPLEDRSRTGGRDPVHWVDRDGSMLRDPAQLLLVLRERQLFPERSAPPGKILPGSATAHPDR
jgi:hypothetical protein